MAILEKRCRRSLLRPEVMPGFFVQPAKADGLVHAKVFLKYARALRP
ncbi:MAG: hypothetical protein WC528_01695 [Patescibacteria group bacterium]